MQQQRLHSPLEARLAHDDQAPVQGLVDGHKDKVKGEQVNSLGRWGTEGRDRSSRESASQQPEGNKSLIDEHRVTAFAAPIAPVV